jgi:hypothetical protein
LSNESPRHGEVRYVRARPRRWLTYPRASERYGDIFTLSFPSFRNIVLREIATRTELRPHDPADERPCMRNVTIAPQHEACVVLERPLEPAGNPQT